MRHRPSQTVQLPNDEDIVSPQRLQHAIEGGPPKRAGTDAFVGEYALAAALAQRIELRRGIRIR